MDAAVDIKEYQNALARPARGRGPPELAASPTFTKLYRISPFKAQHSH